MNIGNKLFSGNVLFFSNKYIVSSLRSLCSWVFQTGVEMKAQPLSLDFISGGGLSKKDFAHLLFDAKWVWGKFSINIGDIASGGLFFIPIAVAPNWRESHWTFPTNISMKTSAELLIDSNRYWGCEYDVGYSRESTKKISLLQINIVFCTWELVFFCHFFVSSSHNNSYVYALSSLPIPLLRRTDAPE